MTQPIITALIATPAGPAPAKQSAKASGNTAQSFGSMLSREMTGRMAPPARPEPQAKATNNGGNASAANTRARQEQQRLSERLNERQQANVAARQADAANRPSTSAGSVAQSSSIEQNDQNDKGEKIEDRDQPDTALTAKELANDTQASSAAAAALLALVGSLAPKDAARTDVTIEAGNQELPALDASALTQTSTDMVAGAAPNNIAGAPGTGDDAAFQAMLEQAAQNSRPATTTEANNKDAATGLPASERGQVTAANLAATLSAGANLVPAKLDAAPAATVAGFEKLAQADFAALSGTPGTPASSVIAANNTLQAAGLTPTEKLTPFVGTSAWDQALGQKVVWMAAGAQQSASLTLNPPDLGPLQVVINVNNAHAEASFTAAQPEVRQALEAALPKLKEMLAEAGISLGQTSVNAGMPNQHGNSSRQQTGSGRGNNTAGIENGDTPTAAVDGARNSTRGVSGNGLVDTFA